MRSHHRQRGPPRLLGLAYDPGIPREKLLAMERLGRALGLPLRTLEEIGQDERCCDRFAEAVREGALARFLQQLTTGHACTEPRPGLPVEVTA